MQGIMKGEKTPAYQEHKLNQIHGILFSEGLARASHLHTHRFLQTIQFHLTFIGLHLTFPSAVNIFFSF